MVYTIFLGKQGKRVYTIGPKRRVYTIEPQTQKKKKRRASTVVPRKNLSCQLWDICKDEIGHLVNRAVMSVSMRFDGGLSILRLFQWLQPEQLQQEHMCDFLLYDLAQVSLCTRKLF